MYFDITVQNYDVQKSCINRTVKQTHANRYFLTDGNLRMWMDENTYVNL